MIQPQTYLNVAENNMARELMCIQIIGAINRRYAHIGDVIVVAMKKVVPHIDRFDLSLLIPDQRIWNLDFSFEPAQ